jgi:hypothetical protein
MSINLVCSWQAAVGGQILPTANRPLPTLISSVRQHCLDALLIAFRDDRIYIKIALTFLCFACQNMAGMAVSTLELASGSRAKTLCGAFVCFKFWHNVSLEKMF